MMTSITGASCRWAALSALAVLTACEVTPPQEINEMYRDLIEERRLQYRIKPGDAVTLKIYKQEGDLSSQIFTITPDGRADPFFMDDYRFEGRTIPEVERDIQRLLSKETSSPSVLPERVSVLVQPLGETVYMNGQFEKPDVVDLNVGMTVADAMAAVRGMKITGDTDYAILRRRFPDSVHQTRFRIDLNDTSEEIVLLPGDEVYLERTFLAEVINYLREYVFGVFPTWFYTGAMASFF